MNKIYLYILHVFYCNEDINKFVLLLKKGVYLYEYMDSWERFDETLLPDKEAFYSSLNMDNITDVDHRYEKRVFKSLDNKNLGDYYDLYVQSDFCGFITMKFFLETNALKYMN